MKVDRQRVRFGILFASFLAFPITIFYFSPYLIVQGAFEGIAAGSMVVFGLQFVFALVLRRAFCGWLCPAGGLQEAESHIVGKPMRGQKKNLLKWVIWVPWAASIVAGAVVAGGIMRLDLFYHTPYGLSVTSVFALAIYVGIVVLFFVPNLFLGRRAMCHCICWMAPFMILGESLGRLLRLPQLHVTIQADRCIECGRCNKSCPMSLPVQDLVRQGKVISNVECIQCAACCDTCPKDVLNLKVSRV